MGPYLSRHSPRKVTVVTGNILSTERYDRYYDFTCDLIERSLLSTVELPAGLHVFRKSKKSFDIEASRTIPPADYSALSLTNRYSGRRLNGMPGEGALYVASLPGMIREHTHYAMRPETSKLGRPAIPPGLVMPGDNDKTREFLNKELTSGDSGPDHFHVFSLDRALRLVDLQVRSLYALFAQHLADPTARNRYQISASTPIDFLSSAVNSVMDYSASRGMADAISDRRRASGVDGICATSSRGESDTGLVFGVAGAAGGAIQVLFGTPGSKLTALKPVDTYASIKDLTLKFPI